MAWASRAVHQARFPGLRTNQCPGARCHARNRCLRDPHQARFPGLRTNQCAGTRSMRTGPANGSDASGPLKRRRSALFPNAGAPRRAGLLRRPAASASPPGRRRPAGCGPDGREQQGANRCWAQARAGLDLGRAAQGEVGHRFGRSVARALWRRLKLQRQRLFARRKVRKPSREAGALRCERGRGSWKTLCSADDYGLPAR